MPEIEIEPEMLEALKKCAKLKGVTVEVAVGEACESLLKTYEKRLKKEG